MNNKQIKDLLVEIEKTSQKAIKEWMATKGSQAAYYAGEVAAFSFIIARLKSTLEAIKDE